MNWSDAEIAEGCRILTTPVQPEGLDDLRAATVRALMTHAVELAAARGGTLSSDHIEHTLKNIGSPMTTGDGLRQHLAAQGARIAALETSYAAIRKRLADAADALADVLPGEVGRLDLLARIDALKAEVRRLGALHKEALVLRNKAEEERDEALGNVMEAAQAMSAHVDAAAGGPLTQAEVARNAIGLPDDEAGSNPPTLLDGCRVCSATAGHPHKMSCRPQNREDAARTAWRSMHPNGSCTCAGEGTCDWCDRAVYAAHFDDGTEAMRAACWEAITAVLEAEGIYDECHGPTARLKSAIEGATP